MHALPPMLRFQLSGQIGALELASEARHAAGPSDPDGVVIPDEDNFVTWTDSELIPNLLRDHDLPLRPHPSSHTD